MTPLEPSSHDAELLDSNLPDGPESSLVVLLDEARPCSVAQTPPAFRIPDASMAWSERAQCRGVDPELFFPVTSQGPGRHQFARAHAVCAACAVRRECLEWSIDNAVQHGVWGGLSEDERRPLVRGRTNR